MHSVDDHHLKRIVVKIGTSLIDSDREQFDREVVTNLARDIAAQIKQGRQVVLVSSGAVGAGRRLLGWESENPSLIDRQALAAVGQPRLMALYREIFEELGLEVAQVLLTSPGLEDRQCYLNARHTLDRLLSAGIVPIVNENDTVATEELQFGDNDRLAAVVAGKLHAHLLVLLTDVEAVRDEKGEPIKRAQQVSKTLLDAAGGPSSNLSRGGMKSKLEAVHEAMLMGVVSAVASGRSANVIAKVATGYPIMTDLTHDPPPHIPGSWFIPTEAGIAGRKRWILACNPDGGTIMVDHGALSALRRGDSSLLPSGVISVVGEFQAGEPVTISTKEDNPVAQGLANLSADELSEYMGRKTHEIKELIGRNSKGIVAVHKDDMVVFDTRDLASTEKGG